MSYVQGKGVAQGDKQAVAWYARPAEQGHAKAQGLLGVMYEQGKGVAQDDKQKRWRGFERSRRAGRIGAQFLLGGMYFDGRGVAQAR